MREDELVLVCSGPSEQLRFTRTVIPHDGMDDFGTSGRVKPPATLRYLIRNKWLTPAQEEGTFTIRLGERGRNYARARRRHRPKRPFSSSSRARSPRSVSRKSLVG
jgi:hypothetical protein